MRTRIVGTAGALMILFLTSVAIGQDAPTPVAPAPPTPAVDLIAPIPDAFPSGSTVGNGLDAEAVWNNHVYGAGPCGAPPLGMTSHMFQGAGHCLERYDHIWAGYCQESRCPALEAFLAYRQPLACLGCGVCVQCGPCSQPACDTVSCNGTNGETMDIEISEPLPAEPVVAPAAE